MPVIKEYLDSNGNSPFLEWFDALAAQAAAKVTAHITRLAAGNFSNVDPVGGGVHEKRIDWGPGLRIYFAQDGNDLVVLLAGSDKRDQRRTIEAAKTHWNDYKQRKRR